MSAPKILSSIVAAAAIVGSVGYVYAQSQSSTPPATTETPQATPPADSSTAAPAASDTTTPTAPSTSNDTSPSTDTTMTPPAEPKAKADRN